MSSFIDFPNYNYGAAYQGGGKTTPSKPDQVAPQTSNANVVDGDNQPSTRNAFRPLISLSILKDYNAIYRDVEASPLKSFQDGSVISQDVADDGDGCDHEDEDNEATPPPLLRVPTRLHSLKTSNLAGGVALHTDDGAESSELHPGNSNNLPIDNGATNNKATPPDGDGFQVVTNLAVHPGSELNLADHLLKTVQHIQTLAPGCMEWEIFHLEMVDEIMLGEKYVDRGVAEKYQGYMQDALTYVEEKGWLNGEPDVRVKTSPGGFALRRWSP